MILDSILFVVIETKFYPIYIISIYTSMISYISITKFSYSELLRTNEAMYSLGPLASLLRSN